MACESAQHPDRCGGGPPLYTLANMQRGVAQSYHYSGLVPQNCATQKYATARHTTGTELPLALEFRATSTSLMYFIIALAFLLSNITNFMLAHLFTKYFK